VDRILPLRADDALTCQAAKELAEVGFVSIPGPFSAHRFCAVAEAYDHAMATASGPDFNIGSTTTRMSALLGADASFEDVLIHEPLLQICGQFLGEDFKLSSFLGRTLRPGTSAQALHADLPRDSKDAPLLGFILMIDPFKEDNGATRFVPKSHTWRGAPGDVMPDTRAQHPGESLGCGEAGTMLLFNAAIWHGHTANVTSCERRSIQGYFVRRSGMQGFDFNSHLPKQVKARMPSLARYLLALQ